MIKLQLKWLVTLACVANCTFSSCMKEPEIQTMQPDSLTEDAKMKELQPSRLMSTNPVSTSAVSSLEIGINGHPFTDAPYVQTSATKQISIITGLGIKWYRINVQTRSDGTVTSSLFESMRQAAAAGSVNLLPMLYLRTLDFSRSEADNYQQGRAVGGNFAAKYGQYFTMYDLGNDLELALLFANRTGASSSDYD